MSPALTSWYQIFSDTAVAVVQKEQDGMLMKEIAICLVWISGGWEGLSGGVSLFKRNAHGEIVCYDFASHHVSDWSS